jgi:hypothetical protein
VCLNFLRRLAKKLRVIIKDDRIDEEDEDEPQKLEELQYGDVVIETDDEDLEVEIADFEGANSVIN